MFRVNVVKGRIQAAVLFVSLVHQVRDVRTELDGIRHPHDSATSFVNGLPESRSHTSQQGCPESSAFLGLDGFHAMTKDIGLDLPPKRSARAAAAQADLLHRYLQLG